MSGRYLIPDLCDHPVHLLSLLLHIGLEFRSQFLFEGSGVVLYFGVEIVLKSIEVFKGGKPVKFGVHGS